MPYQTFLQVKSGADAKLVEKKIDAIYKREIAKQHYSATTAFQRTVWFRHALLTFQFVIAMVFISGALILNKQLDYMRHGDKGFDPAEVVHIKNMKLLNKPEEFRPFRDRMKAYPGIEYTTVATSVPGGIDPLAILTVAYQSLRAARSNPVDSLREE